MSYSSHPSVLLQFSHRCILQLPSQQTALRSSLTVPFLGNLTRTKPSFKHGVYLLYCIGCITSPPSNLPVSVGPQQIVLSPEVDSVWPRENLSFGCFFIENLVSHTSKFLASPTTYVFWWNATSQSLGSGISSSYSRSQWMQPKLQGVNSLWGEIGQMRK